MRLKTVSILFVVGLFLASSMDFQQERSISAQAQSSTRAPPPIEWSKTYGGPYGQGACSVQQTTDGGVILARAPFCDLRLAARESTALDVVTTIKFENSTHSYLLGVDEERNRIYACVRYAEPSRWRTLIIDGESNDVIGEIPLEHVQTLWINPGMNRLIIPYADIETRVYVYDLDSNEESFQVESFYAGWIDREAAYNPTTNLFYVGRHTTVVGSHDRVWAIDGETFELVHEVNIPGSDTYPYIENVEVALNPEKNWIYAAWSGNDTVFLINGATHEIVRSTREFYVGSSSIDTKMQVNPYTGYVYLTNSWCRVLDGETLEAADPRYLTIDLMAVDSTNNFLYARDNDTLCILNGTTHEKLTDLELDKEIQEVMVNSKTGKIYVDLEGSDITVVQRSTEPVDETTGKDDYSFVYAFFVGAIILVCVIVWSFRKKKARQHMLEFKKTSANYTTRNLGPWLNVSICPRYVRC